MSPPTPNQKIIYIYICIYIAKIYKERRCFKIKTTKQNKKRFEIFWGGTAFIFLIFSIEFVRNLVVTILGIHVAKNEKIR